MVGQDQTIPLPEFWGEGSDDPKNHLFIYEKIFAANYITDEDTKVV
jgi:hypothetical protein